ncbi:MAG: peptidase, partial [Solirubrobacterales bacterium]
MTFSLRTVVLAAAASLGVAGCTGYDGYGGLSLGYGGGYYDGYGYGSGYGSPYYGWYDGFYYPGTGYYIYDNGGRRHRWSDGHRRYWEGRRGGRDARANWSGYRRDRIEDRREVRQN